MVRRKFLAFVSSSHVEHTSAHGPVCFAVEAEGPSPALLVGGIAVGGTLASTAFYSKLGQTPCPALRAWFTPWAPFVVSKTAIHVLLPMRLLRVCPLAAACLSVPAGQNLGRLGTKIASGGKDDGYERGQGKRR